MAVFIIKATRDVQAIAGHIKEGVDNYFSDAPHDLDMYCCIRDAMEDKLISMIKYRTNAKQAFVTRFNIVRKERGIDDLSYMVGADCIKRYSVTVVFEADGHSHFMLIECEINFAIVPAGIALGRFLVGDKIHVRYADGYGGCYCVIMHTPPPPKPRNKLVDFVKRLGKFKWKLN